MKSREPDYIPILMLGVLAGTIITISLLIGFRVEPSSLENIKMQYSDLVTIILTAVTVILAVLAVFIGILAVWGYSQFEKMTKSASADHLNDLLSKGGPFSEKINNIIVQHVSNQLEDGELRKILTDRVDAILITDAGRRSEKDEAPADVEFED